MSEETELIEGYVWLLKGETVTLNGITITASASGLHQIPVPEPK